MSFILGNVLVGKTVCETASVTCRKLHITTTDGSYITIVPRPGTYALQAHVDGCKPVIKKVTIAKLGGKAKQVNFTLKPAKKK